MIKKVLTNAETTLHNSRENNTLLRGFFAPARAILLWGSCGVMISLFDGSRCEAAMGLVAFLNSNPAESNACLKHPHSGRWSVFVCYLNFQEGNAKDRILGCEPVSNCGRFIPVVSFWEKIRRGWFDNVWYTINYHLPIGCLIPYAPCMVYLPTKLGDF